MFRSLWCKLGGVTLKRSATIINGDSSSSTSLTPTAAKYLLSTAFQNQNVVISNSRVASFVFYPFSTASIGDDSSFVVSYLINSCGLSQNQAITASKKLNFKTTTQPDSVLTLLKAYGFTQPHISRIIIKYPSVLSSNPDKTLKPKLDFFDSRGLCGIDLADYISIHPTILRRSLNNEIISSFDILKGIVQSDENVITMIKRDSWILSTCQAKRMMVNLELLGNEGVPQSNISKFLIQQPRAFARDANSFNEVVEKVKEMGFNHLRGTYLRAINVLTSLTEANWRKKMDVYKRWGWSEDQIQSAFRKNPQCMMNSEKKITVVMNFLVNEMGYDSSSIADHPLVISYSMKERIIPRCSVGRILVSKGLIKEMIPIPSFTTMVDESFLETYVQNYELEVPELVEVFYGQLSYQDLLQN